MHTSDGHFVRSQEYRICIFLIVLLHGHTKEFQNIIHYEAQIVFFSNCGIHSNSCSLSDTCKRMRSTVIIAESAFFAVVLYLPNFKCVRCNFKCI